MATKIHKGNYLYKNYRIYNCGYHQPDHCVWWEAENLDNGCADYHANTKKEIIAMIDEDSVRPFCRNAFNKNNREHLKIINDALQEIDPYIAPFIKKNLLEGMSYEKICSKEYMYIGEREFYSYCRLAIAKINKGMQQLDTDPPVWQQAKRWKKRN